ncbi:MAG: ADP-forming succinate--CoA ligase subunit beta [Anaerolineaceae bacterium]|nr:ADP-forming succinate--CoA ligase subunit beta [Anaerolineaceae bacterium]
MQIHEYQAKAIPAEYHIQTPKGFLIRERWEILPLLRRIETDAVAIKAQIHAGGRGKAGGVRISRCMAESQQIIESLLGSHLVTTQTSKQGLPVKTVLIEEITEVLQEFYLALTVDRTTKNVSLLLSSQGGVDFERKALQSSDMLSKIEVNLNRGIDEGIVCQAAASLHLNANLSTSFAHLLKNLYACFIAWDASLLEINPLALSTSNTWIALDAKMELDDNALFRHPLWETLRDNSQITPTEVEAQAADISYVSLNGNIGCLVNGAGLAMATMDAIQFAGGEPANFLDIGGQASAETVCAGLEILLNDPHVQGVFINIFGGIVRCDVVAQGILKAIQSIQREIPIVLRLDGNEKESALKLLKEKSDLIQLADGLKDGVCTIVQRLKEVAHEHLG